MTFQFKMTVGIVFLAFGALYAFLHFYGDRNPYLARHLGKRSIAVRLSETESVFLRNLQPKLLDAGVDGYPAAVTLVYLKDIKELQLFAGNSNDQMHYIKTYPVKGASGEAGPKLREGDRQVPEGIYRIESLNPNSAYFLSLRLNYPNGDDKRFAKIAGRDSLGSDIMIHGSNVSIGCIAIGDEAIAELFHLAGKANFRNWKIILAPVDLRSNSPPGEVIVRTPWITEIYEKIKAEMERLPSQNAREL